MSVAFTMAIVLAIFFGVVLTDTMETVIFYRGILKEHVPVCGQEVKENPKYWASEGMLCFSPPNKVCKLQDSQFVCE